MTELKSLVTAGKVLISGRININCTLRNFWTIQFLDPRSNKMTSQSATAVQVLGYILKL